MPQQQPQQAVHPEVALGAAGSSSLQAQPTTGIKMEQATQQQLFHPMLPAAQQQGAAGAPGASAPSALPPGQAPK